MGETAPDFLTFSSVFGIASGLLKSQMRPRGIRFPTVTVKGQKGTELSSCIVHESFVRGALCSSTKATYLTRRSLTVSIWVRLDRLVVEDGP